LSEIIKIGTPNSTLDNEIKNIGISAFKSVKYFTKDQDKKHCFLPLEIMLRKYFHVQNINVFREYECLTWSLRVPTLR